MIRDVNDTERDCRELVERLSFPCRVNLIPLSEIDEYDGKTTAETVEHFIGELEKAGINTTVRWSKGIDANAAAVNYGLKRVRKP